MIVPNVSYITYGLGLPSVAMGNVSAIVTANEEKHACNARVMNKMSDILNIH